MIAACGGAGDGARSKSSNAIGHEPFALLGRNEMVTDLGTE
jgi:hypothetical protein